MSDATLVLGVRNGDRSAFAELYDRRARLIRAICYDETHDLDAAADLTQEVFLRAYRSLGDLRDSQYFAGWLVGIARQACREYRRRRFREERRTTAYRERKIADEANRRPPDDHLALLRDAIAGSLDRERRSIPTLTDRERLALHTFYLQGRSVQEARSVLGLSRSGFYRVLSSACKRLRKLLTAQEVHP